MVSALLNIINNNNNNDDDYDDDDDDDNVIVINRTRRSSVVECRLKVEWSLDQSLMVNPMSDFLFQSELHNSYN